MLNGLIEEPYGFFKAFFLSVLAWIFITPFSFLVPKKKNLILFWGRDKGRFTDSVKYIYLYASKQKDVEVYFVTSYKDLFDELTSQNLPALLYGKIYTYFCLLRAKIIVVDSIDWSSNCRYNFLYKAKKVQIWHGVALKKIGFDNKAIIYSNSFALMRAFYTLRGRFPLYDLLVSTSDFVTEKSYVSGIKHKKVVLSGYPRNDILLTKEANELQLIGSDKKNLEILKKYKKEGKKLILYAPTFRDTKRDAIATSVLDIEKLDEFCEKNNIIFTFKTHSWGGLKNKETINKIKNAKNIIFYENSKDVYPLLPFIDVMVSDYSSIYIDFLFLDKPILFFCYDLEEYKAKDRELYFDYEFLTPGKKCKTSEELFKEIENIIIHNQDEFAPQRDKIKKLCYQDIDTNSSSRLFEHIKKLMHE